MFWSALDKILNNEFNDLVPHYIKVFCEHLLRHDEPKFIRDNELRFIVNNKKDAKRLFDKSGIIADESLLSKRIVIMDSRGMTNQVPIDIFRNALSNNNGNDTSIGDGVPDSELSRLMECISVKDGDADIHLLCDDPRSLMRIMYNSTLVMLRSYEFPHSV